MKHIKIGVAFAAFTAVASGAVLADDETFGASATILEALVVAKTADLSFASIAPSTTVAGTILVGTDGNRTCATGLTCSGTTTAASFDVTGEDGATFAVTLPAAADIDDGNGNAMNVNNFVSSLTGNTGTLTGGAASFQLGASLDVGANQTAGAYAGNFVVTVEYN